MQQKIKLRAVVKASSGTFPGVELADLLEKYARFVRKSTYTGELELTGTFLDASGGVVWDYEGNVDGTSNSTEEG